MTPRRAGRIRPSAVGPALLLALALALTGADWRTPPPDEGPETIPVRALDGESYVAVNDLARILDATKFWRADVRKLVLRSGSHTIVLTVDDPFALIDDSTRWLGQPVRSKGGELQVPVELIAALPSDSTLSRLSLDLRHQRVVVLPPGGSVGTPRIQAIGPVTRLVFPADHTDDVAVVARSRAHFRLRFGGVFLGALPDSLPEGSLLREIRPIAAAGGSAFECRIDPAANGYHLVRDPDSRRVTLELNRERGPDDQGFAPEGPRGERRLRVVVLDPGHGGSDRGVVAGPVEEKDLTLALARELRAELERRGVRVVLTRDDDRDMTADERAERANRADADLMLALHFDGYLDSRFRGATAYCPPATVGDAMTEFAAAASEAGDAEGPARGGANRAPLLSWRDVATRHAVESRSLAEAVLSSLELRGLGPTRLRERLAYGLLGVDRPGLLLECATLTSVADRDRLLEEGGLKQLAVTLAEGLEAYRRNE